jgi:integrase
VLPRTPCGTPHPCSGRRWRCWPPCWRGAAGFTPLRVEDRRAPADHHVHQLRLCQALRQRAHFLRLRHRLDEQVGRPLADDDLLLSRVDGTWLPVREYSREFTAQRKAAGLKAITLGKLRHSNISRMRAAGIAADVVAAWHGHTERMTQAVYGRVTDDRLTAASAVFSASAVGQS